MIRGHSFRAREGVHHDVNALWPLLSRVRPNDPTFAPHFVDPRDVLEGEPQVGEGVLDDMPAFPTPPRPASVPADVMMWRLRLQPGTQMKMKRWMLI